MCFLPLLSLSWDISKDRDNYLHAIHSVSLIFYKFYLFYLAITAEPFLQPPHHPHSISNRLRSNYDKPEEWFSENARLCHADFCTALVPG